MKTYSLRPVLSLALGLLCLASAQAQVPANLLDRIQAAREVRVCIWPDYYGVSLRNPKTLQLNGVDTDLALELGKDLGVGVTFVDSSFAKLIPDVTGKRCDVAMFAVGITPQRTDKLRFTQPTLASDIYAITNRNNRRLKTWDDIDKPGVVVAVMKGTLHEPIMRDRLKAAQLLVVDTPLAREQEVESGRADVFMTDFPYSRRMLETTDWARLISPASTYHMTNYAYAVAPGDDVWFKRMEQFVSDIKRDGRLLKAASRYKLDPIVVKN
ncbi:MAG: ABC transporter substrate-binding protein [Rhodoferax sp.]|nr:ABC transporter substrate-binding protein [Rhodoferax sp.]